MFRFALLLLTSLALSSHAVAAVKWNNSSSSSATSGREVNISTILPSETSSNYYCNKELGSFVNDFVVDEEKSITDKRLNSSQDILKNEDFFNDIVNLSLYNRTALVIQQPNNSAAVSDLKAKLLQIGKSEYGTKIQKSSTASLIHKDFLLLYSHAVLALKENDKLSDSEFKTFTSFILQRMNIKNLRNKHHFKMSGCSASYLGEKKFDVFACQNHAYGSQHLRMLVGVLTGNKSEIKQGQKLYRFAIDDLGSTGALWREASRGAYSWTYYAHALSHLVAIGDIDRQLGGNLFTYQNKNGQSIHDAVEFYVESLNAPENPGLMWNYATKNMGIDKPRKDWNKPKSLAKHERVLTRPGYSEWFPIYAYNFTEHPNVNAFKDIIKFNPYDEAPEFTYHLGLNSWCTYDYGE